MTDCIQLVCVEFIKSHGTECPEGFDGCACLFTAQHIYTGLQLKCTEHEKYTINCKDCSSLRFAIEAIAERKMVVVSMLFQSTGYANGSTYSFIMDGILVGGGPVPNNVMHHIRDMCEAVIHLKCIKQSKQRASESNQDVFTDYQAMHTAKRNSMYVRALSSNFADTAKNGAYGVPGRIWDCMDDIHTDSSTWKGDIEAEHPHCSEFTPPYNFYNISEGCGCFGIFDGRICITLPVLTTLNFKFGVDCITSELLLQNCSCDENISVIFNFFLETKHFSVRELRNINTYAVYSKHSKNTPDQRNGKNTKSIEVLSMQYSNIDDVLHRLHTIHEKRSSNEVVIFPRAFGISMTDHLQISENLCARFSYSNFTGLTPQDAYSLVLLFGTQRAQMIYNDICMNKYLPREIVQDHIFTLHLSFKPTTDMIYSLCVDFFIRLCLSITTQKDDRNIWQVMEKLSGYDAMLNSLCSADHDMQHLMSIDTPLRSNLVTGILSEVIFDTLFGGPFRMHPLECTGDVLNTSELSEIEISRELKHRFTDTNGISSFTQKNILNQLATQNIFFKHHTIWQHISSIRRFFEGRIDHSTHPTYSAMNSLVQHCRLKHKTEKDRMPHEILENTSHSRLLLWSLLAELQKHSIFRDSC